MVQIAADFGGSIPFDRVAARLAAIGGAAPFNCTAQALVVEAQCS